MYKEVKVEEYVKELLGKGVRPIQAEKSARIYARQGIEGEEVITWSEDKDGTPIIEKVAKVELDEETHLPGYVVTKIDDKGLIEMDQHGHTNTWIIDFKTFHKRYMVDQGMGSSFYKSSAGVQLFIQIQDDIIIEQWGKKEKIAQGGYINITDVYDMYGISERDFEDTYVRVLESAKLNKK